MSTANSKQVGGSHYAAAYQHWDLVVDLEVPYLEAQIIKYTERHSKKNGRQDLEKARHFAEKLKECASQGRVRSFSQRDTKNLLAAPMSEYFTAHSEGIGKNEKTIVMIALTWEDGRDIEHIIRVLTFLIDTVYPREEGAAP